MESTIIIVEANPTTESFKQKRIVLKLKRMVCLQKRIVLTLVFLRSVKTLSRYTTHKAAIKLLTMIFHGRPNFPLILSD